MKAINETLILTIEMETQLTGMKKDKQVTVKTALGIADWTSAIWTNGSLE